MNYTLKSGALVCIFATTVANADVNFDLDDIDRWDMVPVHVCLDLSIEKIDGYPVRMELKTEGDDLIYEFEIKTEDGTYYNVECNAEEGFVDEVERIASAEDNVFKKYAKVSVSDARATALDFHPGKVVSTEYEVGFDGSVTYEFDIHTDLGPEVKVDVCARTGEIEEANFELYEIGSSEGK